MEDLSTECASKSVGNDTFACVERRGASCSDASESQSLTNVQIDTLAASLNLLCSTLAILPSCSEALLEVPFAESEESPTILLALRDTLLRYLEPEPGTRDKQHFTLAVESLRLFEMLAWCTPDTHISRFVSCHKCSPRTDRAISSLSVVVRAPKLMPTLVSPKQDKNVVLITTRILTVLSTRELFSSSLCTRSDWLSGTTFFRQVLAKPYPAPGDPPDVKDSDTVKHLGQLYSYLAEPTGVRCHGSCHSSLGAY